ncbi:hypothetical protein [Dyella sp. A6]|uniref:hypothetical protein n=1 Tax=Dyella aluminiiresistens TaxID=3069105 RepID=UPI002E78830B|nr:hypothetical protein [Dyella sp. A6]
MSNRVLRTLLVAVLLLSTAASAQSFDPVEIRLFRTLFALPSALARYTYLQNEMPHLNADDRIVAMQMLASAESELGLYNRAVFSFPIKVSPPPGLVLPTAAQWRPAGAVDVIARLAAHRHIVMVNEAHHDAQTRVLALALLPRLYALGFRYFAAEALVDTDPGLQKRGYPVRSSGTEYLHEPIYGEIVREAIRLGFTIVPYDIEHQVAEQARETGQAENLYREVFAKHPDAHLFVLAGYAHIDKAKGRLGDITPMAMHLEALSGHVPLSIDQTQFLETGLQDTDNYHRLIARFRPTRPIVLINRSDGKVWSADPKLYDANVILPPALSMKSFGNSQSVDGQMYKNVADPAHLSLSTFMALDKMFRPAWLSLGGKRQAFPISAALCRKQLPCVVEAQYADESDNAIAADRYAFLQESAITNLYLFPGKYHLRAIDSRGKTLDEQAITIPRQ